MSKVVSPSLVEFLPRNLKHDERETTESTVPAKDWSQTMVSYTVDVLRTQELPSTLKANMNIEIFHTFASGLKFSEDLGVVLDSPNLDLVANNYQSKKNESSSPDEAISLKDAKDIAIEMMGSQYYWKTFNYIYQMTKGIAASEENKTLGMFLPNTELFIKHARRRGFSLRLDFDNKSYNWKNVLPPPEISDYSTNEHMSVEQRTAFEDYDAFYTQFSKLWKDKDRFNKALYNRLLFYHDELIV